MRKVSPFFLGNFYSSFLLVAQTIPTALDYLKMTLRIFYVANINTKDPDISERNQFRIVTSKSQAIFDDCSNNGIKLSARILTGATIVAVVLVQ